MLRPVVLGILSLSLSAADVPVYRYAVSIPGSDRDTVAGMTSDANGNIYIAANTLSLDLPTSTNAIARAPRVSGLYRLRAPAPGPQPLLGNATLSTVAALAAGETPNTIYAATATGLLKSADAGDTWAQVGPFLNHPLQAVLTAPSNPSVVYAAGEPGIYRSSDAGATWSDVTPAALAPYLSFGSPVISMHVSTNDPSIVVTGFNDSLLYRTTDGGVTWTSLPFLLFAAATFDDAGTLYAIGAIQLADGTYGASGLYRSSDNGSTWQFAGAAPDPYVTFMLLAVPNASTLYAGGFAGIYRSIDAGATWTRLNPGAANIIAASADFSTLYEVTGTQVLRSVDGGATWAFIPVPVPVSGAFLVGPAGLFSSVAMVQQIYVAEFDSAANFVYGTYLGGSGSSSASGIAVDSNGEVTIIGQAGSPSGPFVARLNSDFSAVISSTTLNATTVSAVESAPDGGVYVAGTTPAPPFETCHPGAPTCPPTEYTAFLTRLSPSGTAVWSTSLAASNPVAVKASSNSVVAATSDGRIVKFDDSGNPAGSAQINGFTPAAITFDPSGNILVGGSAAPAATATPGSFQTAARFQIPSLPNDQLTFAEPVEGFIAKLAPDMSLQWATRYGGESTAQVTAIAADNAGNIIAGGTTTARALPMHLALFGFFAPSTTGFIAKFNPQGTQLVWSTYAGDFRPFSVSALLVDSSGNVTFSGQTLNPHSLANVTSPYSGSDIFISSIGSSNTLPAITLDRVINTASRGATPIAAGALYTIQGTGFDSKAKIYFNDIPVTPEQTTTGEVVVKTPAAIAGLQAVVVHVETESTASNPVVMSVATAAPALYTVDQSGVGQAVIYNEDGTPNSSANPAAKGSVVTIVVNGVDSLTVTASITTQPGASSAAQVIDSTATSVRVRVPQNPGPSLVYCPVTVTAAGAKSQDAVYLVVK